MLPRILPAEQLPAALSLNMTVMMAGSIAGPMIGGLLIPVLGYSWLYLIDTLTLFATLSAVWLLPPLPVESRQGSPGLRSVIEGFAYLSRHPVLLMSFAVDLIAMIFGMPRALFPQVAHESFGGPIEGGLEFAVLNAAMPVGAVLGGVLSGWVARVRRQGRAVNWAIGIWGWRCSASALRSAPHPDRDSPGSEWRSRCSRSAGPRTWPRPPSGNTILLSAADDAVRGRLQGVFIVVVAGGPRIADALHGYVATGVGTAWTIAGGGLAVVIGIVLVSLLVPVFYRYEVTPPP